MNHTDNMNDNMTIMNEDHNPNNAVMFLIIFTIRLVIR